MDAVNLVKKLKWDTSNGYDFYRGILVVWDEDHDERILRVIDKWSYDEQFNVMAISESQATLNVVFKYKKSFDEIEIENDVFVIGDYIVLYPAENKIICGHKKTEKRYRADENTGEVKKIGIYCADCGKWIKWESFVDDADFVMPFGKFKGQKIVDIVKNEKTYALWACGNLKGSIKARFVRLYDGK